MLVRPIFLKQFFPFNIFKAIFSTSNNNSPTIYALSSGINTAVSVIILLSRLLESADLMHLELLICSLPNINQICFQKSNRYRNTKLNPKKWVYEKFMDFSRVSLTNVFLFISKPAIATQVKIYSNFIFMAQEPSFRPSLENFRDSSSEWLLEDNLLVDLYWTIVWVFSKLKQSTT